MTTGLRWIQTDPLVQTEFLFSGTLPSAWPMTFIWRCYPEQKTEDGYYSAFFYGDMDSIFDNSCYYGCNPYPNWDTTHNWALSIDGNDRIIDDNAHDTTVVKGQWYVQACVVRQVNTDELEVKFYWDLSDTGKVITYTTNDNYCNNFPSNNPGICWGSNPWNVPNEMFRGVIRAIQIYSTNLSLADIQTEAANDSSNTPQTSAGLAAVWFMNQNPTPDDISDKSGEGHNPSWVNANRPELWEGVGAGLDYSAQQIVACG